MDHFNYRDSEAHCEGFPLKDLADRFGTPVYVYSEETLSGHCSRIQTAFQHYPSLVCYAVKANSNHSILKTIFRSGLGADVVSVGELERSLRAGARPEKIVFSGVGKREDEIARGLEVGILSFNVESSYELELIASAAKGMGKVANISLRINPNIDAKTHPHIATGLYSTKFGLTEEEVETITGELLKEKNLSLVGIACHLGSQITELAPYQEGASRMIQIAKRLKTAGYPMRLLDLGGGLGIRYQEENPPSLEEYSKTLIEAVRSTGLTLVIEPGRSIVGNAGVIITRVLGIKKTTGKTFVVVDAAMNDLIRPALYEAKHAIMPVRLSMGQKIRADIVGPVCETADTLGKDRELPELKRGDLLFIRSCGAYGASMGSRYNSRLLPAEVLVSKKEARIIRKREPLESLWENET